MLTVCKSCWGTGIDPFFPKDLCEDCAGEGVIDEFDPLPEQEEDEEDEDYGN